MNAHDSVQRVQVEVYFDGGVVARRTYLLAPRERWSLDLDEAYAFPDPSSPIDPAQVEPRVKGVMANAGVFIRCDKSCAPEKAIYYAPIGQGAPSISAVPFVCREH